MSKYRELFACLSGSIAVAVIGAAALTASPAFAAPCTGPGAPTTTQTKCLTAITIPGNPLRSFDISWTNPDRAEYYLADRSNAGIDIIDTHTLKWVRTIGGFVGIRLNSGGTAVNNNISGPDGVTSHGRWLYAGDGDSTLKVIDLNAAAIKQIISTGGTTRVDEMALTSDGKLLLAANNAEDPPFATLFAANGDNALSNVTKIIKITVDPAIMPTGAGLSIEQPAWDPKTKRFYTSLPIIANNPMGCNYGQVVPAAPITCHGGLLVTDPLESEWRCVGAFNPTTNTGVVPLPACSPNGATVGPHDVLMLGCTPGNNPSDTQTTIISAVTKQSVSVNGITGSDEVFYNRGDNRYYLGASRSPGGAKLGVVSGKTKFFIEGIPESSGSHSVAADSKRNLIFVPQVAPASVVGTGGDTTTVGAGICGGMAGCIAVYKHDVDDDDDDDDRR